jgi:hypothetical protein
MSQRLELRRWCKAVNAFGLGRGTNAYFFLALPDQICRGEREADAHVPPTAADLAAPDDNRLVLERMN